MKKRNDQAQQISENLEVLIVAIKSVNETCVSLTEDISPRELNLISYVGTGKDVIMKDIADHLGVPLSTATGIVDKLVQKKYLKRHHSEKDRRIVLIELDQNGQTAFQLFKQLKEEMSRRIIRLLSDEETILFIELLQKITSGLHSSLREAEVGRDC